ncbi:hypothetical protein LTR86_010444 [Recurvomyces mirabilis]|nr:hypothetical protein LTR86_010444 [Recurvomyces mirabilis]
MPEISFTQACERCNSKKIKCHTSKRDQRCDTCIAVGAECRPKVRKKRKTLSTVAAASSTEAQPVFDEEASVIVTERSQGFRRPGTAPGATFSSFGDRSTAQSDALRTSSPRHIATPTVRADAEGGASSTFIGRAHYDTTTPIDEDSARAYGASKQDAQSHAERQTLTAWQAFDMPPRSVHQSLMEAFMEYCYPWMPTLDAGEQEQRSLTSPSYLLLQAIFTAASRVVSSSSVSDYALPSDFYHRARALFWVGHETNPLTVRLERQVQTDTVIRRFNNVPKVIRTDFGNLTVKSITMLHWYNPDGPAYVSYDTSEYWLKIGVGLAYQIGLHREPAAGTQSAMRRRIWWSLVARSSNKASSTGRRADRRSDCHIGRPTPEDFPESTKSGELFVPYVDICCALGDVVESFARDAMTKSRRLAIENVLFRWSRSLPGWLQVSQWNEVRHEWNLRPYDFRARQLNVIYFVTLTILSKSSGPSRAISPTAICAASYIAGMYEDFLARDQIRLLSPTYTTFCFMAGLVLLPLRKDAILWEHARADLLVIQRSLEILANRWRSAIGASKALQKAMESPTSATARLAPLQALSSEHEPLFHSFPVDLCRMWLPCQEHAVWDMNIEQPGVMETPRPEDRVPSLDRMEPEIPVYPGDFFQPFDQETLTGMGDGSFDYGNYFWSDWNLGA